MNQAKRLLALLLTLATVLSTIPLQGLAAEMEEFPSESETTEVTGLPTEEETEVPVKDDAETDAEENVKVPVEDESEVPGEEDAGTPAEGDAEAPGEEDAGIPAEGDAEAPGEEDAGTPAEEDAEAPGEEDAETPAEEDAEAPGEEESKVPAKAPARVVSNAEVVATGTSGDVSWTVYDDGALVIGDSISGNGKMADYKTSKARPWFPYIQQITSVEIEEGVTSIGENAFYDMQNLSGVEIPDSVTSIGDSAFYWTTSLTDLVIPASVTSIGKEAFQDSLWLKSQDDLVIINGILVLYQGTDSAVTVPNTVTSMVAGAFSNTSDVKEITLPDSMTSIPDGAFLNCQSLTDVTLPSGIKTIPSKAFQNCRSLTSFVIPSSVTSIGEAAFDSCVSLTDITIPDGVKTIEYAAFRGCENLRQIVISASVTTIGKDVFDEVNEGLSIYGYTGSGAETELKKGGFTFVALPLTVDISTCTVSLSATRYTYDGSAKKPTVTVRDADGELLTQNTDYTVAYTNNIKAGTATVTVTGTDGYTGQVSKTFTIDKANQSVTASISASGILYGATATITAKGVGALSYTSDHTNVATVDASGVVKGKGGGTATIAVTAAGDANHKPATATVKVTVNCATPAISKLENTLNGVRITWNKVDGADKYRVFVKNSAGVWTVLGDTTETTYTDTKAASDVKYTYTVRCISANGKSYTSGYSSAGKSITYKNIPVISKLESNPDGVRITWGLLGGAAKYHVFRKNSSGSWKSIGTTAGGTFTDTGAIPGNTYAYTVCCISADGKTYTSGYDRVGKTIKHMPTPALSQVENLPGGGIRITWGKVNGAVKYRVYRKTGSGNWVTAGDTAQLTFTDTKVTEGATYTYTVRCFAEDGVSVASNFDRVGKTITCTIVPVIAKVENVAGGVWITWEKVNGAARYRVYRKTGSANWQRVGDATGLTLTDATAVSGVKYTYTVRCISNDGKRFTSSFDRVGKSITYIAAPTISKTESLSNGVRITWGKVDGAAQYRVYRRTGSGGWVKVEDTAGLTFTDTNVSCGIKYTYTVRCFSGDGKTAISSYDTAGKSIVYLTTPILTGLTNVAGGVQVTWEQVNGAAKYRVFRKKSSGSWSVVGDTTALSLVDTNVPGDSVQTYTVRCLSADGRSYTSDYDRVGITITVPAYSTPVSYSFSLAYRTGPYYSRLMSVKVGNDQRQAIVDVARSQLGYTEGNSKNATSGNAKGSQNYTEYGLWYYNNIDSSDQYYLGAWCSMFASWCANEAGIPASVIPRRALVAYMKDAFEEMGRYYTWKQSKCGGGKQDIRPGDLIIFSSAPLGRLNHIGIVSGVSYNGSNVTIHTIEGNKGDCCCEKTYTLSKSSLTGYVESQKVYIRGFACPDYNT